jgi:predicted Fe-Mo cluster-binding NifX family protein
MHFVSNRPDGFFPSGNQKRPYPPHVQWVINLYGVIAFSGPEFAAFIGNARLQVECTGKPPTAPIVRADTTAEFPVWPHRGPQPICQIDPYRYHGFYTAMTRIAIPTFRVRVSPVLDTCTRLLFIDIEQGREIDRKEVYLDALSLTERLTILRKSRVSIVICGGVSEVLENMLLSAKIDVISDITGEIEPVLQAYLSKRLDEPKFHMPGFRTMPQAQGIHGKEKDHESR